MVRQDKYEVGDQVRFIDRAGHDDDSIIRIQKGHQTDHGAGPYTVEHVHTMSGGFDASGHTQIIRVKGRAFSGWWVEPVRS